MTEQEKIRDSFARLDLFKAVHYSSDKKLNQRIENQIKDFKIEVFKYGYDEACERALRRRFGI